MPQSNYYGIGDAFKQFPELHDGSVDLVMTSVPDMGEVSTNPVDGQAISEPAYREFLRTALDEMARVIKPKGFVVLCQTDRRYKGAILSKSSMFIEHFRTQADPLKLKESKILLKQGSDSINLYQLTYSQVLIFTKRGAIKQTKRVGDFLKDVWEFEEHQTKGGGIYEFPLAFPMLLIQTLTQEGDLVLDPFAGRGTVLKAAQLSNRRYLGWEFDPEVYDREYVEASVL